MAYYRITVVKVDQVTRTENQWQKVADFGNPRDREFVFCGDKEKESKGGPQYDYVPVETTRDVEVKILEQQVEKLNLAKVIRAINGLF